MTIALWIIAIVEVIRAIQNAVQLASLFGQKKEREYLNNQFIDSLKKDNKEWCEELLQDFLNQKGGQAWEKK